MSQLKCPLCGKSGKFENVKKGDLLVCPKCQCSFPAPAPSPRKKRTKKTSKAKRRKKEEEEQARLKQQESLVFYSKFIGFGVTGLIVAGVVFQIVVSVGTMFMRSSQRSALEIDLKYTFVDRLWELTTKRPTGVQVKELELDWDRTENAGIPFSAKLVDFVDNRKQLAVQGVLEPSSGKWSADLEGFWMDENRGFLPLYGQISTWNSLPVFIAFILALVALGGAFQIWRSQLKL